MTAQTLNWTLQTDPRDREFRAPQCKQDQHQPGCDGYYPPGRDTYRCQCTCHAEVPSGGDPDAG